MPNTLAANCEHCGVLFNYQQHGNRVRKFCGLKCTGVAVAAARRTGGFNLTCEQCGTGFNSPTRQRRLCSNQCRFDFRASKRLALAAEGLGYCTKCKVTKSLDEFYQDVRKRNGRATHCKSCMIAARDAWRKTETGRASEREQRRRQYAKKDKGAAQAYQRQWTKANPVRYAELQRRARLRAKERRERDNHLPDGWVAKNMGLSKRVAPSELIAARRAQIILTKLLKEHQ